MRDNRRKVRRGQTIVPFGVGGILDLRGESFAAADVRGWGAYATPVDSPRLAAKLRVEGFRSAPVIPSGKARVSARIGPVYVRFPKWLFCPQCRRMTYWRSDMEDGDNPALCTRCSKKSQLAPMRFIQVCRAGHMADIDWRWWAHSRAEAHGQRNCQAQELRFEADRDSSGLDALSIRCLVCRSRRSLTGISQPNSLKHITPQCPGTHPWSLVEDEADSCEEVPQAVQRGASNVYFPVTHSALDIPTPTGRLQNAEAARKVVNHKLWPEYISSEGDPLSDEFKRIIAVQSEVSEEYVEAVRRHHVGEMAAVNTDDHLSVAEWAAFSAPESVDDSKTFTVRHISLAIEQDAPDSLRELAQRISSVVVADRVREVRALEGFTRYEPGSDENDGFEGERIVAVDTAHRPHWLPAIETYGEGIFISVDETLLSHWERIPSVRNRALRIENNLEASFKADRLRDKCGPRLLPRFVMLHTLAHQFIRQLSYDSGYNAASLRERVYARSHPPGSEHPPQAGVFIYTAAGDAEGTLGGLVRQGQAPHLSETLIRLLESAQWCSQDPLCADSHGRSLANLNRAACHACTLLPETCCEADNSLLDRTLLVGDGDIPGFFHDVVEAAVLESAASVEQS
ncbi:DUF1998 domain-containing protein [Streptomyces boncukensis]|uniref:DUF1998 domain-containing protein n=1 Tax=Streptomyces boncukensis TaxID=2711219 RepID=A0A6G4WVK8_9ACTN|nr:DUF1998 domain-containing protein [Streptomyces boncukensis]NGO68660.1 DUF1998 domain-containing protein [Streptomyces boncukensis]